MSSADEVIFLYHLSVSQILQVVGDWFKAKRINYTDELFTEYFEQIKENVLKKNGLKEYLSHKTDEIIFQWLSIYHKHKQGETDGFIDELKEIVPEWFMKGRYEEIEQMFNSKFFKHTFTRFDVEYDSNMSTFYVTLDTAKELDSIALEILKSDIQEYLSQKMTLIKYLDGKILEPMKMEFTFEIEW
jgi:hypothetical protein